MKITNTMKRSKAEDLLLISLVNALSSALDERTHFNVTHTQNMAFYANKFLDWLDETKHPFAFDYERRKAFILSVWLHDVGKITIPTHIMMKPTRLGYLENYIIDRFRIISLLNKVAFVQGAISRETYEEREQELNDAKEFIKSVNRKEFLSSEDIEEIEKYSKRTYVNEKNQITTWFTDEELECLTIQRGTLNNIEREKMKSHVLMTDKILKNVAFPDRYKDIRRWVLGHHEFLDGSGYPNGLSGNDISDETRLLTIMDIFEALTAKDRPYKEPKTPGDAIGILQSMAQEGKIDAEILSLFYKSGVWRLEVDETDANILNFRYVLESIIEN